MPPNYAQGGGGDPFGGPPGGDLGGATMAPNYFTGPPGGPPPQGLPPGGFGFANPDGSPGETLDAPPPSDDPFGGGSDPFSDWPT